jgi:hypothetical protein
MEFCCHMDMICMQVFANLISNVLHFWTMRLRGLTLFTHYVRHNSRCWQICMMKTENVHKDIQLLFLLLGVGGRMASVCEIWCYDSSDWSLSSLMCCCGMCTNIWEEPAASITKESDLYGQCSMIKDCTVYRIYNQQDLRFLQWCCRNSSVMGCDAMLGEWLPISWRIIVLWSSDSGSPRGILRRLTSRRTVWWIQEMKALGFFKRSGTSHPVTHCHIPGDVNTQTVVKPKYSVICRSFTHTRCSKSQDTWTVSPPTNPCQHL